MCWRKKRVNSDTENCWVKIKKHDRKKSRINHSTISFMVLQKKSYNSSSKQNVLLSFNNNNKKKYILKAKLIINEKVPANIMFGGLLSFINPSYIFQLSFWHALHRLFSCTTLLPALQPPWGPLRHLACWSCNLNQHSSTKICFKLYGTLFTVVLSVIENGIRIYQFQNLGIFSVQLKNSCFQVVYGTKNTISFLSAPTD